MSVIQVLTLAGGVKDTGNSREAWILRPIQNTSRRAEIPINIHRILRGEDVDKPLLPNDVLYVQKAGLISKNNIGRILQIALPVSIALAIAVTR